MLPICNTEAAETEKEKHGYLQANTQGIISYPTVNTGKISAESVVNTCMNVAAKTLASAE